jgi:hypothetical protein
MSIGTEPRSFPGNRALLGSLQVFVPHFKKEERLFLVGKIVRHLDGQANLETRLKVNCVRVVIDILCLKSNLMLSHRSRIDSSM